MSLCLSKYIRFAPYNLCVHTYKNIIIFNNPSTQDPVDSSDTDDDLPVVNVSVPRRHSHKVKSVCNIPCPLSIYVHNKIHCSAILYLY